MEKVPSAQFFPLSSIDGKIQKVLLTKYYVRVPTQAELERDLNVLVRHFDDEVRVYVLVGKIISEIDFARLGAVVQQEKLKGHSFDEVDIEVFRKEFGGFDACFRDLIDRVSEKKSAISERVTLLLPEISWRRLIEEYMRRFGFSAPVIPGNAGKHSKWAQDSFFVMRDESQGTPQHFFLRPYYVNGENEFWDRYVADQVASQSEFLVKPSLVLFEGGDVLSRGKGRFTLVSPVWLEENKDILDETDAQEILDKFSAEFPNSSIHFVGGDANGSVPKYEQSKRSHLDMFLTLGGTRGGQELFFLASPQAAEKLSGDKLKEVTDHVKEIASWTDKIDAWLKETFANALVVRIPFLVAEDADYTYNNCLVESFLDASNEEIKRVYLPLYQSDALDCSVDVNTMDQKQRLFCEARAKFLSNGFTEVRAVPGMDVFISGGGSLHCITKVLERGPAPS